MEYDISRAFEHGWAGPGQAPFLTELWHMLDGNFCADHCCTFTIAWMFQHLDGAQRALFQACFACND